MSTKKEQRELKRPDAFQTKVRDQLEKLIQKPTLLFSLLAILGVTLGGYFLSTYYHNSQLEKRATEIYAIDKIYQDELEKVQEKNIELYSKITEINNKIMDLESNKEIKPENKKSSLDQLKNELKKTEQNAKKIKGDHTKSSEEYYNFYQKNPRSSEGIRAAIHLTQNALKNNDYNKAKKITEQLLNNLSKSSFFYSNIIKLHVSILEEMSQLDLAINETNKLLMNVNKQEEPSILLLKGRLLIKKENNTEAKKILDSIITHFHATQEIKSKARAYKALIF